MLTSITILSIRKADRIYLVQYIFIEEHMTVFKGETKIYQTFILERCWILSILCMKGS